jgi:hypothetical protein
MAGHSGIDDACARHDWQLRDGGRSDEDHNDVDDHLDRAYGGDHLSAARHSSGSPQRHPERAFSRRFQGTARAHPSRHRSSVFGPPVVPRSQDHAPQEAAFTSGRITPWVN